MSTVEKIAAGMFGLIALYLIIASRGDFNLIIGTLGSAVTKVTKTLQGR